MSDYERQRKKQESERESGVPPRDRTSRTPRSDRPRHTELPSPSALPRSVQPAGNAAIDHMLARQSSDRPLDPTTRAQMEVTFASDLSQVRVHEDPPAEDVADALGATAFTRGADIHVGRKVPTLDSTTGKELLAHELAHVIQQRRAGAVDHNRVSKPGDASEQVAASAARKAVRGGHAEDTTSGTVPGIQRQMADPAAAYRAEIQQVLEAFLWRVLATQGGQRLRADRVVRNVLITLVGAGRPGQGPLPDPKRETRLSRIESFLTRPALPGKPDEFAREAASHLPNHVDRSALYELLRMPVAESAASGLTSRLSTRPAPDQLEKLEPSQPSMAQERSEPREAIARRWAGEEEPTTIGPVSPQEIVKGASDLLAPTPAPRSAQPEAQSYAPVEQVIRGLAPAMQAVARQVARELDLAFQQRRSADLELSGPSKGREPTSGLDEGERTVRLIRDALPHHAAGVLHVRVYVGNRLVKTITLKARSQ